MADSPNFEVGKESVTGVNWNAISDHTQSVGGGPADPRLTSLLNNTNRNVNDRPEIERSR